MALLPTFSPPSPGTRTIRGILVVLVGVLVLMGSVYLILATNTGARLGFLLILTGALRLDDDHGLVWWIYGGSGPEGRRPGLGRRGAQPRRPRRRS